MYLLANNQVLGRISSYVHQTPGHSAPHVLTVTTTDPICWPDTAELVIVDLDTPSVWSAHGVFARCVIGDTTEVSYQVKPLPGSAVTELVAQIVARYHHAETSPVVEDPVPALSPEIEDLWNRY